MSATAAGSTLLHRRRLRRAPCQITQLQQAHRYGREQSQQAYQPLGGLDVTLLEPAARFETLMILFDDPPTAIPVHALPGVFTRLGVATRSAASIQAASSPAGGSHSQTRTAQTGSGSLLPRGSFQGGNRVAFPKLSWSVVCLAWRP